MVRRSAGNRRAAPLDAAAWAGAAARLPTQSCRVDVRYPQWRTAQVDPAVVTVPLRSSRTMITVGAVA